MESIFKFVNDYLASIVTVVTLIGMICTGVFYFLNPWRWRIDKKKDLLSLWGKNWEEEIRFLNSNYFIPFRFQTTKPLDVYEKGFRSSEINSSKTNEEGKEYLIPTLLDDILNRKSTQKRYMILGGSGMGKSTFSAKLFLSIIYNYKLKKCPFPFYVRSLLRDGIFEWIELKKYEITQNKQKINEAVLILDGLDENSDAITNYKEFLEKLESATSDFRVVVVTSRTQLFPDKYNEPGNTKIKYTAGDGSEVYYDKYYISPFNDEETDSYIRNKYKKDPERYKSASIIINQTKDLVSRPMILSSIDGLLHMADRTKFSLVEIYLEIVDHWRKRDNRVKDVDSYRYYKFTKQIALFLYEKYQEKIDETNNEENKELSLRRKDFDRFLENHYQGENPYSFRVRSLLNRTDSGRIKFSHRSFYELFLAINAMENPGISFNLDDKKASLVPVFFDDLYSQYRQKKELPYIVYPNSDNINIQESFASESVKKKFKIIKEALSNEVGSNSDILPIMYDFLDAIIRRFSNQVVYGDYLIDGWEEAIRIRTANKFDPRKMDTPEKRERYYEEMARVPATREKAHTDADNLIQESISLLCKVQDYFFTSSLSLADLFNQIEIQFEEVLLWDKLYSKTLEHFKRHDMPINDFIKPKSPPKAVLFHDIINLDENQAILYSYIRSSKECYLGYGFNDDDKVLELIKIIKEKERGCYRMFINRKSNEVNNALTRFIKSLSELCSTENEVFILALTIHSEKIYYVVTNKTSALCDSDIESCLINMLNAKKQLTSSE